MWRLLILILILPFPAQADSLVATRVIRAHEVISKDAVTLVAAEIPGAMTDATLAIGLEARVAIYPGRPVLTDNIGPAAVVERNQIVSLSYRAGGLIIRTEGRALDRGGAGEVIEVMNLASKTKVSGRIGPDGSIELGNSLGP